MKRPLIALFGFAIGFAVVHAIVAFWTPIQADDWNHWIWAGRHADESGATWATAFATSHFTFSEAVGYLLARCRLFHVLVTPAVLLALVVGLFVLAMRRWPKATWNDVLALVLTSALIWLAQPYAGSTLFHTAYVAAFVYGSAVAVWFAAPFACGWHVRRALWPLLALAGYAVGTSTRAIATATLIGVIIVLRKRRERWMWIGFGGLVVGTIVGYVNPPWLEVTRVFRRGFEQNLVGPGLLKFIVEEGGEIVSLVAALVLVDLVLGHLGRSRASADDRPDPTTTLRWFGAWFLTAIWCLFGPRYNEATLLPASCMLVIGALPYFVWLASSRDLRIPIILLAIAVHAIVWTTALAKYHRLGAEGAARLAALEAAPAGGAARIDPYSRIAPDFWFLGEDLGMARPRVLLAVESFGLRDIELTRLPRRLDVNPNLELVLETDGVTEAQLRAAKPPAIWAGELTAARKQFDLFTRRLRSVIGKPVSARLAIRNVFFDRLGSRPLLAAWLDSTGSMIPRTLRSSIDPNAQITTRIYPPESRKLKDAWVVANGNATHVDYHGGSPRFEPKTSTLHVVIACNPDRCLAIDAFVPRF